MKIAIISPTSIPSRRANTLQVMKMSQALAQLGQAVQVAIPGQQPQTPTNKSLWEELAWQYGLSQEFPLTWLPAQPRLRRYDYGLRAVRWAQSWGADLVYTRLPQAAAYASWSGLQTILEIHDIPHGLLGPWLLRRFLDGPGALRLVAITQALADDLERKFPLPASNSFIKTAPDGVDLERYASLPEPSAARRSLLAAPTFRLALDGGVFSPETFTAGYSGHLYAGRGAELILALAQRLPQYNFLVVGGEPQEVRRLRGIAKEQGVGNLILTGFVPNAELPLYQAACDVLMMPYQWQVAASSGGDISRYLSPMKLFEYLACGRAILASDLPVLQEVLNAQNAVILPAGDVGRWAAALQALQSQPGREKLAQQARLDAARYTWKARAGRILEGI